MDEIKFEDLVVGETYFGGTGDKHKILAIYRNEQSGCMEVVTFRTCTSGLRYTMTYQASPINKFFKETTSLADKLNRFRQSYGSGSGTKYWEGLEEVAKKHFSELINK